MVFTPGCRPQLSAETLLETAAVCAAHAGGDCRQQAGGRGSSAGGGQRSGGCGQAVPGGPAAGEAQLRMWCYVGGGGSVRGSMEQRGHISPGPQPRLLALQYHVCRPPGVTHAFRRTQRAAPRQRHAVLRARLRICACVCVCARAQPRDAATLRRLAPTPRLCRRRGRALRSSTATSWRRCLCLWTATRARRSRTQVCAVCCVCTHTDM